MNFSVKIVYTPKFGDHNDLSKFKMICESGNEVTLNCKGHSKRFAVSLSSSSINFGEVRLNSYSSKTLTINNNSELETDF